MQFAGNSLSVPGLTAGCARQPAVGSVKSPIVYPHLRRIAAGDPAIQYLVQDAILKFAGKNSTDHKRRGLSHWQKTRRAQDCSCARDGFGRKPVYAAFASSSRLSPLSASNSCRSAASWHLMQYLVHGTASKRLILMSSSQCMQTP